MAKDKKELEKNRIVVNLQAKTVEVESSTESLDKVLKVLNSIFYEMGRADVDGIEHKKKIVEGAIR